MLHQTTCRICRRELNCDCAFEYAYIQWKGLPACDSKIHCDDCRETDTQETFEFEDADRQIIEGCEYKIVYKNGLAVPVEVNPKIQITEVTHSGKDFVGVIHPLNGSELAKDHFWASYKFTTSWPPDANIKLKNIGYPVKDVKPEPKPKIDHAPVYIPGTVNTKGTKGADPFHTTRKMKVNMHSKLGKALLRKAK